MPRADSTPVSRPPKRRTIAGWLGSLRPACRPFATPEPGPELSPRPPVYQNAVAARTPAPRRGTITRTQYTEFGTPTTTAGPPIGTRRIRAFPRSDVPVQLQWIPNPQGTESVAIITSGVNLIIDGLQGFGSVDISTDRLVIWTAGVQQTGPTGQTLQSEDVPLEIYMEGNVVFRQGNRIIQAPAMYYDVRQKIGVVLNAEMLTPLPTPAIYPGLVRLRAKVLRQVDQDRYVGEDASFTTSRFGDPTYEVRANQMVFEDIQHPEINVLTGAPEVDPRTGEPRITNEQRLTSYNNFVYFEDVPIFYWPVFSGDLEKGDFYINKIDVKTDSVFGTQFNLGLDLYQIFGIRNPPKGSSWDGEFDYYSERGPAAGMEYRFGRDHFFDIPGKTTGLFDAWVIDDHGIDDLGLDRRAIVPEDGSFRGRVLGQYRQQLPNDWQITAEFGWQSDRNFLEEYYIREFDSLKDQSTDLELRRNYDNSALTITGAARVNQFYTETQWLPRLDHYWLGQPLIDDTFTWYEHTNIGYANQNEASVPTDSDRRLEIHSAPLGSGEPQRAAARHAKRSRLAGAGRER